MSESTKPSDRSLTGLAVRAGVSAVVMMVIENLLILVRTLVLSRLLNPHEFGLMGMAFIAINTAEVLSQTGFGRAVVQSRDDPEPYLHTLWTVSALRGLGLATVVYFLAPWLGTFFRTPEAVPVLRAVSAVMFLRGLVSPAWLLLERDMRLLLFSVPRTASMGVDLIVTCAIAFYWPSVWAMVIGSLAGMAALVALTYVVGPYRPRPRIELSRAREMRTYGKHVFRFELISSLVDQGDRIVIGRLRAAADLGLYTFAYRLATLPTQSLFAVVVRVAFPAFAKIQGERDRAREAFLRLFGLIAVASLPVAAGMSATAHEVVPVFFGAKWIPMIVTLQILSVLGAFTAIEQCCAVVCGGLGHPHLPSQASFVRLIIIAASMVPATAAFGIEGAASAALASALASCGYMIWRLMRVLDGGLSTIAVLFAVPSAACAAMIASIDVLRPSLASLPQAGALAILVVAGAVVFLIVAAALDRLAGSGIGASLRSLVVGLRWGGSVPAESAVGRGDLP